MGYNCVYMYTYTAKDYIIKVNMIVLKKSVDSITLNET